MRVQRVLMPGTGFESWTVLGEDHMPVEPIERFLSYLASIEKSPNTIKAYAHDLKDWLAYLNRHGVDWRSARLEDVAGFVAWLRMPPQARDGLVAVLPTVAPHCSKSSVNRKLSAVTSFCGFHARHGVELSGLLITMQPAGRRRGAATSYKPFLHHVSKRNGERRRTIKLKAPRQLPKVLTASGARQGEPAVPDSRGRAGSSRRHDPRRAVPGCRASDAGRAGPRGPGERVGTACADQAAAARLVFLLLPTGDPGAAGGVAIPVLEHPPRAGDRRFGADAPLRWPFQCPLLRRRGERAAGWDRAGIKDSDVVIFTSASHPLNVTVSGPLDSAGFILPLDSNGIPGVPVALLFEGVRDRLKGPIRDKCTEYAQTWKRTASDPQISTALLQLSNPKANDRQGHADLVSTVEEQVVANRWGAGWPTG